MAAPVVTVVIPNYNGRPFLPKLLESLAAQTVDRPAIIIVDDRSRDDSVAYIRDAWPEVRLHCNQENLGFAGTCNVGLRAATTPYVALLNNDTHVDRHWLAEGIKPFDDATVGSVASLVLLAEPPHRIDSAGDIYSVAGGAVKRNHLQPRETAEGLSRETFSACAASAFYRGEAVAKVGYLDERFVSYYEDVDLGFRLARAGFGCVLAPKSICYHHLNASYGPAGWPRLFNSSRNAELIWWADLPDSLRRRYLVTHLLAVALQGAHALLRGKLLPFVAGKLAAMLQAGHIHKKRAAIESYGRLEDEEIDALLEHDWWRLHAVPKIREYLDRLHRGRPSGLQ